MFKRILNINLPARLQDHTNLSQNILWNYIQRIIEPHPNITDREDRHRSRLLNSLLVIYAPIALIIVMYRLIFFPNDYTSTLIITSVGLLVVATIYATGRAGHYRLSIYVTLILGYGVIYANAVNSNPPHFEISNLIFVPLLGIVLFTMREAIFNYTFALLLLVIFLTTTHDIERSIKVDLLIFMILTQGFILLASYQRNRLDENRRELAIEREKLKLTKQLIDNVSHDFKTPLSIIQTSLYLIRKVDTPEKREQGLARIEQQAFRIETMVQDLLTVSTLDQTHLPDTSDIDLEHLLTTAQLQLSSLADAKQITIKQSIQIDKPVVQGYLDELMRMSLNLIENAIAYTPEGGQVRITLSAVDDDHICLEIADTGIGIDDEDLTHIFDRFYRADKARSTHTGGSGLGLAIVQRIVERHHGTITVKSQVNVGTTVLVVLPTSHNR